MRIMNAINKTSYMLEDPCYDAAWKYEVMEAIIKRLPSFMEEERQRAEELRSDSAQPSEQTGNSTCHAPSVQLYHAPVITPNHDPDPRKALLVVIVDGNDIRGLARKV